MKNSKTSIFTETTIKISNQTLTRPLEIAGFFYFKIMTNLVYVSADENGSVINISKNNSDFGWVTLRQDKLVITNGWAQNKSLSTIILGKVENLEAFNFAEGQALDGKIIVREQLTPFIDETRDVKVAGSTGVVCKVNGQPIYRKTFYTMNTDEKDIFIQHDNVDEIRQVLSEQKFNSVITSTTSVEELTDAFDL